MLQTKELPNGSVGRLCISVVMIIPTPRHATNVKNGSNPNPLIRRTQKRKEKKKNRHQTIVTKKKEEEESFVPCVSGAVFRIFPFLHTHHINQINAPI